MTEPQPIERVGRRRAPDELGGTDPAPAGSGRPRPGALVTYSHTDPVTGETLRGAGVVLDDTGAGGVHVAPLSVQVLQLDPQQLHAVDVDGLGR